MTRAKPEREFSSVEETPWTACAGAAPRLQERLLACNPVAGLAKRILRLPPHIQTTPNGVRVHDFWEEVPIPRGSFSNLRLGRRFIASPGFGVADGHAHAALRNVTN